MPSLLFIPLALGAIATVLSACSNSNKQSENLDGIDIIATPSKKLESKDTNSPSDSYKPSATVPTTKPTAGMLASASPTPASTTSASPTSTPLKIIAATPKPLIIPDPVENETYTAKDIESLGQNKAAFEGKKIINTKFSGANLSGFSFRGSNLDFNEEYASATSFTDCNLDNADFTKATIDNVSIRRMNLDGVKFTDSSGGRQIYPKDKKPSYSYFSISGSNDKESIVKNTDFTRSRFKTVIFERVNFQNVNFQDCAFDKVSFKRVRLDGSNNLKGANFSGAFFTGDFYGADFSQTKLDGASIDSDRNTQYPTFKSINLSNTRYKFVRVDEALRNSLDSNSSSSKVREELQDYKKYVKNDSTYKSVFIAVPKSDPGKAVT